MTRKIVYDLIKSPLFIINWEVFFLLGLTAHVNFAKNTFACTRTRCAMCAHTHTPASFWQFKVSIQLIVCIVYDVRTYHTYVFCYVYNFAFKWMNEKSKSTSKKEEIKNNTHFYFASLRRLSAVPTHSLAYAHDICIKHIYLSVVCFHSKKRKKKKK